MSSPRPSARWGRAIVDELAHAGIRTICIAPGSRSTPLVVAAADHPDIHVYSILDERSAAYFALGRAKCTGRPTAIVSTSGTATANFHPAVIEADRSRTPLVVCTADRPPELQESGANQTISQRDLYGDAVRLAPEITPPCQDERSERSLRAAVGMAVARSRAPHPGPVHLNVPLRKPLTPDSSREHRDETGATTVSPLVSVPVSHPTASEDTVDDVADMLSQAECGILVAGPTTSAEDLSSFVELAAHCGYPLLADPLSGLRFGEHSGQLSIGGYDSFLDSPAVEGWPTPDVVIRVGARPTSTRLETYLAGHDGRYVLLDPCTAYRDPTFSATDVVPASPSRIIPRVLDRLDEPDRSTVWLDRFTAAESAYWNFVGEHAHALPTEGRIAHETIANAPPDTMVFVSNSMPIRDVDRFGQPSKTSLHVLGNRGASGIDGILSTGLGAASTTGREAVILTGDLAFYHDMNGLLAIERCGVDATIVIVNNDGGGIFHMLPIAEIDPPFTDLFRSPHELDFAHAADLYGLAYVRTEADDFEEIYSEAIGSDGTTIVDVAVDAGENHRQREAFQRLVRERLAGGQ